MSEAYRRTKHRMYEHGDLEKVLRHAAEISKEKVNHDLPQELLARLGSNGVHCAACGGNTASMGIDRNDKFCPSCWEMIVDEAHRRLDDLKSIMWEIVDVVEKGHIAEAVVAAEKIRTALAERGLSAGCHEGSTPKGEQVIEWYAGQFLDIVDHEAWFAMNSLLNAADRFLRKRADA